MNQFRQHATNLIKRGWKNQLMIKIKQMIRGRPNNCETLTVYIFFILIVCSISLDSGRCEKMSKLVGLDFEVFGRVQGNFT